MRQSEVEQQHSEIKLLDNVVVDQIAAGEVIERPSSVVKELLENAIDAGAKRLTIAIEEGGQRLISIQDDGLGMNEANLRLCVERFATSKLELASDLLSISSYGFRGEALSSIASIADLSIQSRARGSVIGHLLECSAEQSPIINELPMPEGTKVVVRNIFKYVPARKEFLRKPQTEVSAIKSLILDLSMARPDIAFLMYSDEKELLNLPTTRSLAERLAGVGMDKGNLVIIEDHISLPSTEDGSSLSISIQGAVSEPLFSVRSASKLRILVNDRIVKNPMVVRSVKDAYGNMLKPGMYPTGVLKLSVDPTMVDVNVHPQKLEVRFRYESQIFKAIRRAVQSALQHSSSKSHAPLTYSLQSSRSLETGAFGGAFNSNRERPAVHFVPAQQSSMYSLIGHSVDTAETTNGLYFGDSSLEEGPPLNPLKLSGDLSNASEINSFSFVGQIFKLYLLFASPSQLAVIDMHAAHERITFFKLKSQLLKGKLHTQELLIPVEIPLKDIGQERAEEIVSSLGDIGIDCEVRDSHLIWRSLPELFNAKDAGTIINGLLEEDSSDGLKNAFVDVVDFYLARLACHASLRRGQVLSQEEAYSLLDQLEAADLSGWCPHGRPVIFYIDENEMEKRFGRIM